MANTWSPRLTFDTKRINEDVPIENVITKYTGVPVINKSKKFLCPFHSERTPSAHIYGNRCKCFGCGVNFTPITLAMEQYPELHFTDVCRQLLEDFGMNVYAYSNLAEIEAAAQAEGENGFYDCFPLTEKELNFIGLQNPQPNRITFDVGAVSYYSFFFGEFPENKELLFDKNGNEKRIKLSEHEAIQMGIISEEYVKSLRNIQSPTMQELWMESEEQKAQIEEMVLCRAREKAEECNARYEDAAKAFKEVVDKHSTREWAKIKRMHDSREKIIKNGGKVPVRGAAKEMLDDYLTIRVMDDTLFTPCYRDKQYAEQILNKVLELQEQRAQHRMSGEKTEKQQNSCAKRDGRVYSKKQQGAERA